MNSQFKESLEKFWTEGKAEINGFHSNYYETGIDIQNFYEKTISLAAQLNIKEFIKHFDDLNVWYDSYYPPEHTHYLYKNIQLASLCVNPCKDFNKKIEFLMKNKKREKFYFIELLSITKNNYIKTEEVLFDFFGNKPIKNNKGIYNDEKNYFKTNLLEKALVNNFEHFKIYLNFLTKNNLIELSLGRKTSYLKMLFEQKEQNFNVEFLPKIKYLIEEGNADINANYTFSGVVAKIMFKNYSNVCKNLFYQEALNYILPLIELSIFKEICENLSEDNGQLGINEANLLKIAREKAILSIGHNAKASSKFKLL